MRTSILVACMLVKISLGAQAQCVEVLSKHKLHISEPSDICPDGKGGFFIVGNKGFIFPVSAQGEQLGSPSHIGYDIEAITLLEGRIIASEENFQRLYHLSAGDLKWQYSSVLLHGGGRNDGVEALTSLRDGTLLASTEKGPQSFFVLNAEFQILREFTIAGIEEVSALARFNDSVYVLSDEQSTIYQIDLEQKSIVKSWALNIINPEGLVFTNANRCVVVSDDEAMWYEMQLN